ncbi:MAG: InlB B-repeat-containing protein [Bacilli bacterium]|nr:InlB B-repeat-containing protein [Bacilli bacterium]
MKNNFFKSFLVVIMAVVMFIPSVKAWEATDIVLSNVEVNNNNVVSFDISFNLPRYYGEAHSWVFVQTEKFQEGDLTDFGAVSETYGFRSLSDVKNNSSFLNLYGIKEIAPDSDEGFASFGEDNRYIEQSLQVNLPLNENYEYYLYLWTDDDFVVYPDAYLGKIVINDDGDYDILDSSGESGMIYNTVKFDTNGGTAVGNQTVYYGDKAINPTTNPTKDGYVFDGWYEDKELTVEYNFNTVIEKNITIYAKWKYVYTIEDGNKQIFKLGDTTDIVIKASGSLDKLVGIKLNNSLVDRDNYVIESGSTILTLKHTFLNNLSAGDYTITFVYSDGSVDGSMTVMDGSSINPPTSDNVIIYVSLLGLSIVGIFILLQKRVN